MIDEGKDSFSKIEEARKKYSNSEKGQEAQKKWLRTSKGKEAKKRYLESEKGQEAQLRYNLSDKGKEARKLIQERDKLLGRCFRWVQEDETLRRPEDFFTFLAQKKLCIFCLISKIETIVVLFESCPVCGKKNSCDFCSTKECEYRNDPYNTNGDCLKEK
jgi:hypothetical protein